MTSGERQHPLRIGVVGAGNVSSHHLRGWKANGCEVVAVCDANRGRAEARADEFDIPVATSSLQELIEGQEPDVLDVATPPDTHADLVEQTLPLGIHVLCQKPLAAEVEGLQRITAAAEAGPGRLMVHENWRFRSWFRELRARLAARELGKIFYARSSTRLAGTVLTPSHPRVPFNVARQPFFSRMRRFIILESAIHQLDVMRYLFGEPVSLYARWHQVSPHIPGEDVALIVLGYEACTVVVERSYASKGYQDPPVLSEHVAIEGTDGSAFLGVDGSLRLVQVDAERQEEEIVTPPEADPYGASYRDAIAHFVEALWNETPFETPIEDNLRTLQLVFGAYASADSGSVLLRSELDRVLESEVLST